MLIDFFNAKEKRNIVGQYDIRLLRNNVIQFFSFEKQEYPYEHFPYILNCGNQTSVSSSEGTLPYFLPAQVQLYMPSRNH